MSKEIWTRNLITEIEVSFPDKEYFFEENKVFLRCVFVDDFKCTYTSERGEKFYLTRVMALRTSGKQDFIPTVIPESVVNELPDSFWEDRRAELTGELRTYNIRGEDGANHVKLYFFVRSTIQWNKDPQNSKEPKNMIYLNGLLVKKRKLRVTPLTKHVVLDIIISVKSEDSRIRKNYIPCVVWDEQAQWLNTIETHTKVELYGWISSRKYFKQNPDLPEGGEEKETYEVMVLDINTVK